MSAATSIEWTDATWNPTRGCSRVSEGCRNCYAERLAARMSKPGMWGHGLAKMTKAGPRWTGDVVFVPIALELPLRWRKPRRIFVNSMSDLFHESLHARDVRRILEVMVAAPQHTYQILTKRPARMDTVIREWLEDRNRGGEVPKHIWLGVSVEDQATADERIPLLLQTPVAKRFVSYEPALGPVDFERWMWPLCWRWAAAFKTPEAALAAGAYAERHRQAIVSAHARFLDWIIIGGESGPGARPFDVAWARSTVEQCKAAGVACFVKQLGARPFVMRCRSCERWQRCACVSRAVAPVPFRLESKKGGDIAEWNGALEDLRVREFPA